ncbi:hypothetical protein JYT22_00185 [Endomicrobium sp. AH-315-J14]|nr:hypothetical protein [Endomicrobium sp. AH-315-J14]
MARESRGVRDFSGWFTENTPTELPRDEQRKARVLVLASFALAAFAVPFVISSALRHAFRMLSDSLLVQTERDLHDVVRNAPVAMLVVRNGRAVFANQSLRDSLALEDEDVAGASLESLLGVASPKELSPGERKVTLSDGRERLMDIDEPRTVNFDGADATLIVLRDITEQRAALEQSIQANRLASIGVLAAGVAHEVNNPLAAVVLSLELVERECGELSGSEELMGFVRSAREEAQHATSIVNEMRMLSRDDKEHAGPIDMIAAIEATLRLAAPRHRSGEIEVDVEEGLQEAAAPEGRFKQVLLNLIMNALDATEEVSRPSIEIRALAVDEGVAIQVEDNGNGIADDDLSKVFEDAGGHIEVSSIVDKGTTFTVTLPSWKQAAS